MSYPQPKGPDLVDRTKEDLKQTSKKVGGFFSKYRGGQYSLYWTYGIVLLCGVIYGIYWVGTKIRHEFLGGKQELAKARFNTAEYWQNGDAGKVTPVDINGDGAVDLIGGYHGLDPSGDYVGAFDGKTGNVLWRVGPLKLGMGPTVYVTASRALIVAYPQDLRLVDLKTGKEIKRSTAPHAIRELCADPSGKDLVVLRNYNQFTQLSLTDLSTTTGDQTWCNKQPTLGVGVLLSGATLPDGMRSGTAIEGGNGELYFSGLQQVPGGDSKGIPAVIVQDKAGERLWRKTYQGPHAARTAVVGDRVYVMTASTKPSAVYAYDARTGKELWKNTSLSLLGAFALSASKDGIYIPRRKALYILEPKDGKLKATLGDDTAL
ncbi:MAG: PQQ-binding-like beta-propeller repeat protein [Polyangiaceae bacterium]